MLTEDLIRGQAQHLIGALLAHNFVPKTLPEELYVKLWDVVMAQLKCVNHEGARAIESAACAERDARIAELTRELEEARSKAAELERDAIRFRFANDSQEEFAICYWHEDEDGGDWWCDGPRGCAIELLDAAIDAAIKEQT